MSWKNYLTPQQLRSFTRRCRFTACGEPADVFKGRGAWLNFVTVNHNTETGASWMELTGYLPIGDGYYIDPAAEIHAGFVASCTKAPEATARSIIAAELRKWASMPADTVAGWSPEQIAAEADRIAQG